MRAEITNNIAAAPCCRILTAKRPAKCDRLTGYHGGSRLSDNKRDTYSSAIQPMIMEFV